MASDIHTFSVKNTEEKKLVELMKLEARRTGRSFSFMVIQALKAAKEASNDTRAK